MDSLYLLIPVALIFCAIAIRLLIWAIDSGQYDDLDKDAWRILAETSPKPSPEESTQPRKSSMPDSPANAPPGAAGRQDTSTQSLEEALRTDSTEKRQ